MLGLHSDQGFNGIIFAVVLEILFLGFCVVFVGLGLSEIKKRKEMVKNFILVLFGFTLAGVSLYVTKLFIQG